MLLIFAASQGTLGISLPRASSSSSERGPRHIQESRSRPPCWLRSIVNTYFMRWRREELHFCFSCGPMLQVNLPPRVVCTAFMDLYVGSRLCKRAGRQARANSADMYFNSRRDGSELLCTLATFGVQQRHARAELDKRTSALESLPIKK